MCGSRASNAYGSGGTVNGMCILPLRMSSGIERPADLAGHQSIIPYPKGVTRVLLPRMQSKLLDSPVRDLAHVQHIRIAAIDLVDRAELLEQLSRLAELAEDLAI